MAQSSSIIEYPDTPQGKNEVKVLGLAGDYPDDPGGSGVLVVPGVELEKVERNLPIPGNPTGCGNAPGGSATTGVLCCCYGSLPQ